MVMTDEHLKVIKLKPGTSREFLDLMNIVVNIEHYYRKMKIKDILRELPEVEEVEKIVKEFLSKYKKLKMKARKEE